MGLVQGETKRKLDETGNAFFGFAHGNEDHFGDSHSRGLR